jgi:hypothetical protein
VKAKTKKKGREWKLTGDYCIEYIFYKAGRLLKKKTRLP